MKVTALAPWYGAKRSLSDRIIAAIGDHRCYWEPFCGSMATLMAKPRATMETVNDLHGDLVNFARTIKDHVHGPALYRKARRTLFAQAFFEDACREIDKPFEPTPERAYWFLVKSWFGRNGVVGSRGGENFCLRFTSNGGQPAKRWSSVIGSIMSWSKRLEGVTILSECGIALCERIEDKCGTVIYCDPPYLAKGEKYVHDFEPYDHARLAEVLSRFRKTRVVVSYYHHPDLESLYPGFEKIDCYVTKSMASCGQRGKSGALVKAPEVLLVNGVTP